MRKYKIMGSRWYDPRECASVAKVLKVTCHRKMRDGAYGINLARALDPGRVLTEIVSEL